MSGILFFNFASCEPLSKGKRQEGHHAYVNKPSKRSLTGCEIINRPYAIKN